jgi:predicted nucleic acid-binding protein
LICADTNCWIAYLAGEVAADTQRLDDALANGAVVMAPPVLAELLTDPMLPAEDERELAVMPTLEILPGFWFRTGKLRAALRTYNYKAKLVDTLIAQCCIDHNVPLLTRDRDFRPFTKFGGLILMV